jgi:hypothetical protein
MVLVILAGGCNSEGPCGTNRIDAGTGSLMDGGPPDVGPMDEGTPDVLPDADAEPPEPTGWAVAVGGDGEDHIWKVVVDDSGNPIVLGEFTNTVKLDGVEGDITLQGSSITRNFLAKLDPTTRKFHWAMDLDGISRRETGAIGFLDSWDGLGVDAQGNIYFAGKFKGSATFGDTTLLSAGAKDIFITKLSPDGEVLWAASAGGPGEDDANDIAVGSDGKVTIGGMFSETADFGSTSLTAKGNNDLFVARLDSDDGSFDWAVGAGSDTTDIEREIVNAIAVDGSGNSFITCAASWDATFCTLTIAGPKAGQQIGYVAKIDAAKKFVWIAPLSAEAGGCIALDSSGNIYVEMGLNTSYMPSPLNNDVIKVYKGHEETWSDNSKTWCQDDKAIVASTGVINVPGIIVDGKDNVLLAGMVTGEAHIGPATLTTEPGVYIAFLARMDPECNFTKVESAPPTDYRSLGRFVASDKTGGAYLVGDFRGTADFGGTILKSQGSNINDPNTPTHKRADGFIWYIDPGPE